MADMRTEKEKKVIRMVCEAEDVDPQHMLDNPQCDLYAVGRIIAAIRAARAGLNARKI